MLIYLIYLFLLLKEKLIWFRLFKEYKQTDMHPINMHPQINMHPINMHPINMHIRDANIHFDPVPHTYTIDDGKADADGRAEKEKKYTSVTTWNHSHFAEFDADAIIKKMRLDSPSSKYYGQTPDQIKAGWDKNRDEAADAGTKMHYYIECYYNAMLNKTTSTIVADADTKELTYFHNFAAAFQSKYPHYKPYRTEWMIYDEDLQLAGSIDMVFENVLDGTLFIYDWKRAKEIKKQSAFMTFALTDCISHLPDTNFWHYALQLNTYKTILERKYAKTVTDLVLVILHPENKNGNYQTLPVPILKKEIEDLFALRKEQLLLLEKDK